MNLHTKALTRKVRKKTIKLTDNQIIILLVGAISATILSVLFSFNWFIIVGFGLIIYFAFSQELPKHDAKWYRYERFCKDNNFEIHYGLPTDYLPPLTGSLTPEQDHDFHFRGNFLGNPFVLFKGNFNKSPGSAIPQEQWVFYTELEGSLPGFVVDAKYNYIKIPKKFKEFQTLKLEGDFSEYFNIYAPKGSQVDVLSVLTPDVMEILKQYRQNTDVIVAGKKIWLLGNIMAKGIDLQNLFDSAEAILPELNYRARSYRT